MAGDLLREILAQMKILYPQTYFVYFKDIKSHSCEKRSVGNGGQIFERRRRIIWQEILEPRSRRKRLR